MPTPSPSPPPTGGRRPLDRDVAPPPARPRGDAAATRTVVRLGVAVFAAALVASVVLALLLGDQPGVLRRVPPFVTWYLACAAWLTTTLVLMRRGRRSNGTTLWAFLSLLALVGVFVVVLLAVRGDAPDRPSGGDGATPRRLVWDEGRR